MRTLSPREQKLLSLCLGVLFLMANLIGLQVVLRGIGESRDALKALRLEEQEQQSWLAEEDPAPLQQWLDQTMPALQSAGKAQGALLEQLQQAAFDRKLEIERQNLLEPTATEFYREVSVNLVVRGNLAQIEELLQELQKPEAFYVVKNLELALDTRSRESEPQARCNLTVAQWFNPETST